MSSVEAERVVAGDDEAVAAAVARTVTVTNLLAEAVASVEENKELAVGVVSPDQPPEITGASVDGEERGRDPH